MSLNPQVLIGESYSTCTTYHNQFIFYLRFEFQQVISK